ncbi:MAG TPA: hypothetical protein VFF14_07715, partial [Candidatus Deferrimicrobium sp.]|nr:hypothetical protein [Candidatus Deferrimicrobium sp.]
YHATIAEINFTGQHQLLGQVLERLLQSYVLFYNQNTEVIMGVVQVITMEVALENIVEKKGS